MRSPEQQGIGVTGTETISIPMDRSNSGSTGSGFVCIMSDKADSTFLQLETRPRSNGCLCAGLGSILGICPMVLDILLPCQSEKKAARIVLITPLWKTQSWYVPSTRASGGLPFEDSLNNQTWHQSHWGRNF